jgi:mannose-6-phosphate isomerase-like protein (cupin superfamily)
MQKIKEYYFKEGCYIEEWLNTDKDEALSIARVRVLPGQTTKLHALKGTVERYVILSGHALVTVGSTDTKVEEKSVLSIAPDQPQKIHNTGQEDLIFLAICTPRFLLSNYYEC